MNIEVAAAVDWDYLGIEQSIGIVNSENDEELLQ